MEWVRGDTIGYGSFSTVSLVKPRESSALFKPTMAVKSADSFNSGFLTNEKQVLDQLGACPQIIRCFGDDYSVENGKSLYNLFLEYASKGSLADQLKNRGGHLQEPDVRQHTRSILKGLRHIHAKGFAHCDIKLPNVLVFDNGDIKIADFGLAKKAGPLRQSEEGKRIEIRGTPLYIAPEAVNHNEYDSPTDIWALGCAVVEMVTGRNAWNFKQGSNMAALLIKIGASDELPEIPGELSEDGKDFLGKCFFKDPRKRWTAEMLLDHRFVAGGDTVVLDSSGQSSPTTTSPRGPFDFPEWVSVQSTASHSSFPRNSSFDSLFSIGISSPLDRIRELSCDQGPNWSVSGSWLLVR